MGLPELKATSLSAKKAAALYRCCAMQELASCRRRTWEVPTLVPHMLVAPVSFLLAGAGLQIRGLVRQLTRVSDSLDLKLRLNNSGEAIWERWTVTQHPNLWNKECHALMQLGAGRSRSLDI